jgi:hypothetical protein
MMFDAYALRMLMIKLLIIFNIRDVTILKQVDALNGADENLDGHACKHRPKMYVCFACKKLL